MSYITTELTTGNMESLEAYRKLEKKFKRISNLSDALALLSWDSQTIMPSGASEVRAEQLATLSVLRHEEVTSNLISDLLAKIDSEVLTGWQRANVREIERVHKNATALSPEIIDAHSRARHNCETVWRTARRDNRFDLVVDPLGELLEITKEIAAVKADKFNMQPYDALLDEYEPGAKAENLDTIFNYLEPKLIQLLESVLEQQKKTEYAVIPFQVTESKQKKLGLKLMAQQGFNFQKGRLDKSAHPFSGGIPDDVRITTRYDEQDWASSLMGVIHETGHALYEQGLPKKWRGQPVGDARGMVLHESQSLTLEMQACRSREFFEFLAPVIADEFDVSGKEWSASALHQKCLRITPNFIRVDADELTYPLHVILRYRLEQSLLSGDLSVKELPLAWNDMFMKSFGFRPTNDRDGCLQDIHWYDGAFGYFPTYTLGAMAAAQLFSAAVKVESKILSKLKQGDFSDLLVWLREHVHSWGSYYSTDEIMERATGSPLDPSFYISHLKSRYMQ